MLAALEAKRQDKQFFLINEKQDEIQSKGENQWVEIRVPLTRAEGAFPPCARGRGPKFGSFPTSDKPCSGAARPLGCQILIPFSPNPS